MVRSLEARVRDLQEQLNRNSSNSSVPPSANPLNAPKPVVKNPSGRKPGGQSGHAGHHRQRIPLDRVKKIVVEHLGVDVSKVTENASFIDDLGADSLDTVELVMAFEEEFGCEIPDDAAEKIVTVKDAVSFIETHS